MRRRHVMIASIASIAALAAAAGLGGWWSQRQGHAAPAASSAPQSPISNPQSLPLHPVVARIVKEGVSMPYLRFNYVIKEIPTDLAAHDIDALIGFITAPRPAMFSEGEWGSLTNDIQEALTVQTVPSEKVASALIDTFRDESRTQLMRDYALQHVGGFAMFLIHTGGSPAPAARASAPGSTGGIRNSKLPARLVSELKAAASQSSKPWSGTALNLLGGTLRAADSKGIAIPGLDSATLAALSLATLGDPSAPLNARLPALQAAAALGSPEALLAARAILADPASPFMLVQAAAAAVSRLGAADDLPLLQTALAGASPHARHALGQAIKSISSKP